jgi:uncharacterized membrane protein
MEKLKTAKRLFFIWFGIENLLVFSFLGSAVFSVAQTGVIHDNPLIMFVILGIESIWSVLMLISIKLISDTAHEKKIFNYYLASFITLLVEKIIQFLVEKAISFRSLPLEYDIPFALLVLISFYFMMKSFELISYKLQEPSFRLSGIGIFIACILFTIGYFLATNAFKTNISTTSIWIAILLCWFGFVIGILVFVSLIEGFFNLDKDIDIQRACKGSNA